MALSEKGEGRLDIGGVSSRERGREGEVVLLSVCECPSDRESKMGSNRYDLWDGCIQYYYYISLFLEETERGEGRLWREREGE